LHEQLQLLFSVILHRLGIDDKDKFISSRTAAKAKVERH